MTVVVPSPYSNEFYNRYWGFEHIRTDRGPRPEAQDGDGGLLIAYTDYLNVESRMISPKINVSGLKNPVLSFYFYHYYNPDTENGYSHAAETMDVETYIDGQYRSIIAKPIMLIDGNGWYRYDIALKDAVGDKDFQIAFHTHNYLSYDMHIDNITVHDVKDYDLTVTKFDVPSLVSVNSSRNIKVTVLNNGAKTATDYSVDLYRDGKLWKSLDGEALEFAKEKTYLFAIGSTSPNQATTTPTMPWLTSPTTKTLPTTPATQKHRPYPQQSTRTERPYRTGSTEGAVLTWNDPEDPVEGETTEGFEAYGSLQSASWANGLSSTTTAVSHTLSATAAAHRETMNIPTPHTDGIPGIQSRHGRHLIVPLTPLSGQPDGGMLRRRRARQRRLADFARSEGWHQGELLWPAASLPTMDSRSSTSATLQPTLEMASFNVMGSVNNVPADAWTLYEFTLPEDAVYFAINCVSSNAYAPP